MPTVLIADDEPSLRRLVRRTIASERYTIVEAADGDAAWQIIRRERPAVVLLDVVMPGRDGLDLTRAIRATPELQGLHVILLRATGLPEHTAAGMAAGADFYLIKPFPPGRLLEAIEQALGPSA